MVVVFTALGNCYPTPDAQRARAVAYRQEHHSVTQAHMLHVSMHLHVLPLFWGTGRLGLGFCRSYRISGVSKGIGWGDRDAVLVVALAVSSGALGATESAVGCLSEGGRHCCQWLRADGCFVATPCVSFELKRPRYTIQGLRRRTNSKVSTRHQLVPMSAVLCFEETCVICRRISYVQPLWLNEHGTVRW